MTGLLILLLWSVAALCVVCVLLHRRWKRCEAELFKSHADLNWCMDERRLATSERDNRIAKGRDAALSRRVPLERRVGRQNVTTE